MPIGFKKQVFSLQEKIDKAMTLTYQIHDVGDSEFMRVFLLDLIEKAFKKIIQERYGNEDVRKNPLTPSEVNIENQIENYKRMQE